MKIETAEAMADRLIREEDKRVTRTGESRFGVMAPEFAAHVIRERDKQIGERLADMASAAEDAGDFVRDAAEFATELMGGAQ